MSQAVLTLFRTINVKIPTVNVNVIRYRLGRHVPITVYNLVQLTLVNLLQSGVVDNVGKLTLVNCN